MKYLNTYNENFENISNLYKNIYLAVFNNDIKKLNQLLQLIKNNYNILNNDSKTEDSLLHIAVSNNNYNIVKLLLKYNIDVNSINLDYITPLHIAVETNNIKIVKLLLDYGANINATNIDQEFPLYISVYNDYLDMTKILLDYGANINKTYYNTSLFLYIIDNSKYRFVKIFKNAGIDINKSLNDSNDTPLLISTFNDDLHMIKLLLELGANPNIFNINKIYPIMNITNSRMLELLIEYNAKINITDYNNSSLLNHYIVNNILSNERINMIKILIKKNINLNIQDLNKNTPLIYSIIYNMPEITKLLLKNNCDINIINKNNQTALHIAAFKHNMNIIKLLLKYNANYHIKDIYNNYFIDYLFDNQIKEIKNLYPKIYEKLKKIKKTNKFNL